jgi:mono/diheme cytochrome c family protein
MRHAAIAAAAALVLGLAAPLLAQDAARGAEVYTEQKCKLCHSIDGTGNKKGPLDKVGSELGEEEIRAWMVTPDEMAAETGKDRKPKMKKYDKLSEEDMNALVAYMLSQKG